MTVFISCIFISKTKYNHEFNTTTNKQTVSTIAKVAKCVVKDDFLQCLLVTVINERILPAVWTTTIIGGRYVQTTRILLLC